MKTVIDAVLPRDFLEVMGTYVQICAHIEKMAWYTLAALRGVDWTKDEQAASMVSLRKSTKNLLKTLKAETETSPKEIRDRLTRVVAQIEAGLEERHMAVHGAWSRGSLPDTYRVDYFTNTSGDYRNPVWGAYHHIDFTWGQLAETVSGADFILRELVEIQQHLHRAAMQKL
jgi:hypothetical protein